MNFNKAIIVGNLTRDPELRYTPSGTPVANFAVAINDKYQKDGNTVENVSYFDIVTFSKQAENCNEYLSKGRPVLIEGKLQQRRWEAQDGTKRSKVEILASKVVFLGSGKDASGNSEGGDQTVSDEDIPF